MNIKARNHADKAKASRQVDVGGHVGTIRLLDEETPPYELRIDREGRWFHEGVEIVREDIQRLFSRHLERDEDGHYHVRIGRDVSPVVVEDAPFIVVRVTKSAGGLMLLLNDGGQEMLAPGTIVFNDMNMPYCRVRKNLDARFSRPAYYQLAEFVRYDAATDSYWLAYDDERIEIDVSGR